MSDEDDLPTTAEQREWVVSQRPDALTDHICLHREEPDDECIWCQKAQRRAALEGTNE